MSKIKPGEQLRLRHGHAIVGRQHPLYNRWLNMRQRCSNPKNPLYKYYGARGIRVCERWDDFPTFLIDIGEPPTLKHSLDRIDRDRDYEPGNVRWATAEMQNNNKLNNVGNRGVRLVTLPDGRRLSIAMAEREFGYRKNLIKQRLNRKWPEEKLFDPPGSNGDGRYSRHGVSPKIL